jgi:hypothetical protein
MTPRRRRAPRVWKHSSANTECTLHQLAPYIGKIKSSIAASLIQRYTSVGDLVVDPFCGAGTIPLEASLAGRKSFAADISPYAKTLTLAKLGAPDSVEAALSLAKQVLRQARNVPSPDLRAVPGWVRKFFHPETLRETIQVAAVARKPGNEFVMACLLGILHHQRPGFLSFPSSHLVPYLRDKKYPRARYPDLYQYRPVQPRLLAKVERCYKRAGGERAAFRVARCGVQSLTFPQRFDCIITSPPYMNALDYGRDNRLRLWLIDPNANQPVDSEGTKSKDGFVEVMANLINKIDGGLVAGGRGIFVVGETANRGYEGHPAQVIVSLMRSLAPDLELQETIIDQIPDIRRTRRTYQGVKTERILVFRRR